MTTCPKCSRQLQQSGVVQIGADTFPVFQCDECLQAVELFGTSFEVALTFALDAAGKPFDPAAITH